MLIIVITAALMIVTAMLVGLGARRWSAFQLAPRLDPGQIRAEVHRHPRAAALARSASWTRTRPPVWPSPRP